MPFWAWTVLPYWSINVFYGLSLFLARTRHELDRHGARLLSAQCIAVACFVAWPLGFSFGQPDVDGVPGLLFAALRGFDQPFNQAPSLHIALAVILWDLYRRLIHAPWARFVLHAWTLAICASVLTTYQHHFIDIPTGALLGIVCVGLWPLERRVAMPRAWRTTRDPQRLKLSALYAFGALACAGLAIAIGGIATWLWWGAASLMGVALNYLGFGARGFGIDDRGRMNWAASWLFAPYRLGAWLNARWWTRRLSGAGEVLPGVWLGDLSGSQRGLRPLVSLCAELPCRPSTSTRCVPMLDLVVPSAQTLRRAAHAIDAAHRRSGHVQVVCALGFSRSAAALACWLVRSRRAASVDEAVANIRRARPQVVLSPRWLAAIREAAR